MNCYMFNGKKYDAYSLLGVSSDASDIEVKKAYKKLMAQYHPDRNPGNEEEANKKSGIVNNAYDEICNLRKGGRDSYSVYSDGSIPDEEPKKNQSTNNWSYEGFSNTSARRGQYGYRNKTHQEERKYYRYDTSDNYKSSFNREYESNRYTVQYIKKEREKFFTVSAYLGIRAVSPDLKEREFYTELNEIFLGEIELLGNYATKLSDYIGSLEFATLYREFVNARHNYSFYGKLHKFMKKHLNIVSHSLKVSSDITSDFSEQYADRLEIYFKINTFLKELIKKCVMEYVPYSTDDEFESICSEIEFELGSELDKKEFDIYKLSSFINTAFVFKRMIIKLCKKFNKLKDENPTYHSYVYSRNVKF